MKLSDLLGVLPNTKLYIDGNFKYLDYISSINSNILTFIDNKSYVEKLSPSITCIICTKEIADTVPNKYGILISENPRLNFYILHNFLSENSNLYRRNSSKNIIGQNCSINNLACIADNNVIIGNNVLIEENVIIRANTTIGDNSIIRAGSVIGGEGFQFNKVGKTFFIKHCGGVVIGNDVEIQYNSCIDRAVFPWDNTIIGDSSKLDNLIHIGHSAKIGQNTLLAACSIVGGSTMIGNNCWIGINSTISNGLVIGDNVSVKLGAVVTKNIEDGMSVSGNFAIEHSKFINFIKHVNTNY